MRLRLAKWLVRRKRWRGTPFGHALLEYIRCLEEQKNHLQFVRNL